MNPKIPQKNPQEPNFYVGVGASAGGLEALEIFFRNMPLDSGMAFVVIQHLSPDYKSLMTDILSKKTALKVFQAVEGMQVDANTIYLIPPKMDLKIYNGKLTLSEQQGLRGTNFPIDLFFASLAQDQGRKAIGVILSGTGSDGTRGLRKIKEEAGLVMVQEIETAAFDGMPRSAISSGLADFILPPELMPTQLINYANHPFKTERKTQMGLPQSEDSMTRLFSLLREKHGVDFSDYKPSTIVRRIERRITINQVNTLEEYIKHIQRHPSEISLLYQELLIGVTNFFRDPEAFKQLMAVHIPRILDDTPNNEELRIWCAGCSTGEEAYSLAIAFLECAAQKGMKRDIKIFATDVDKEATIRASVGRYPESVAVDIPRGLLEKYFIPVDDHYQVNRELREMIVFAQHNLIKDPPFTNISLISCRNLLIYLQPVLQRKVMDLFNFSLRPQGILFLGSSETVGEAQDLFESLDNKWKILQAKGIKRLSERQRQKNMLFEMGRRTNLGGQKNLGQTAMRDYIYDRLLDRFLSVISEQYVSFGMLVNSSQELLHIIGNSNPYLRLPAGKVQTEIDKLLHRDLAIPISTGIQKVVREPKMINYTNIYLSDNGKESIPVNVRICPVPQRAGMETLIAVFIEEQEKSKLPCSGDDYDIGKETLQRIADLENELQYSRENLQATVEELETANEELQATNEELLASNEELQSTNEELQSVNEELFTVNAEYQDKITELTEANNDLDNLLSSIHMATIYLDENLELRRFTPESKKIFRVLDKDIGRPFSHLAHNLVGIDLEQLIYNCQRSEKEISRPASTEDGERYLLRILPYRIAPRTYTGLVLSFIELSILEQVNN